jgi:transcriptional regulator with XRE-family HTH domain
MTMTPDQYRRIRELLGWTQAELAAAVGVDRMTAYRREAGIRPIDGEAAHAILRVAELRGVAVPNLLEGDDERR